MLTAASSLPLQREAGNSKLKRTYDTMPFKSEAQRGFFNANRTKMQRQGVNVDEWNRASKGKDLPARAPKKRGIGHKLAALDSNRG